MKHLFLDHRPKRPATGTYRCARCGMKVTADTSHPWQGCEIVAVLTASSFRREDA